MDGVPVGGEQTLNHVLLGPGARAEFIMTTPPIGTLGQLVSLNYDRGPDGEANPHRTIANITASANIISSKDAPAIPHMPASKPTPQRFAGLADMKPARARALYFSEKRADSNDPKTIQYFITEEGSTPKVFDMNFKHPDITVTHGTVEDWTIENRAQEAHVFHIHQLHFQALERDGKVIPEPMLRDTIDVPYWDGKSDQYPSVKLRMDFRNTDIVGTFVYHCHILEHEDGGMMGSIRVK
jgi:FtsP/CotA-like multicopper oxidase with cupredoxin domain